MPLRSTVQGLVVTCLLGFTAPSLADWTLDGADSSVMFTTTKNESAVEFHTFGGVTGSVRPDGQAVVRIDLGSVDTKIPIRDERMRALLFDVDRFATATFESTIDVAAYTALTVGESTRGGLSGTLSLHGQKANVRCEIIVTRSAPDRFRVTSLTPLMLTGDQYGLAGGIEALRNIAGLTSISGTVPVTFVLDFSAG